MRSFRFISMVLLIFVVMMIQGCGGGSGGASGAVVVLALSSTTLESGNSTTGTVTITGTSALNNIQPTIKTDLADMITGTATSTSLSGVSNLTITATNTGAVSKIATVWVECAGIKSNVISVTINPLVVSNTLTLSMGTTADITRTVAAGAVAGSGSLVVSGNKVTFSSLSGNISNQSITISIDMIDNWSTGDSVTLNGTNLVGVNPVGSTTVVTDTSGTALIPTTITGVMPAAGTTGQSKLNVFNVYWRATTTYLGVNYVATGSTIFTGTTTAE